MNGNASTPNEVQLVAKGIRTTIKAYVLEFSGIFDSFNSHQILSAKLITKA